MIDGFLLGVIATGLISAGVFFLKFWRTTGDFFFLAFAASFIIEALNRCAILFVDRPNEASPWTYVVRLISSVMILAAILWKNYSKK